MGQPPPTRKELRGLPNFGKCWSAIAEATAIAATLASSTAAARPAVAAASQGLKDSARHVIGCLLTQYTRIQYAFDDVASTIHQSLLQDVLLHLLPARRLRHAPRRHHRRKGRGVIENNVSNDARSMTYLQGNCSYRRADTVRGGRPTYEHLPTSRLRFIVDPTSVQCLFSITPMRRRCDL